MALRGQRVGEVLFCPRLDVGDFDGGEASGDFGGGRFAKERGERQQQVREAALGVLLLQLFVQREARFQDLRADRHALAGLQLLFVVAEQARHVGDQLLAGGASREVGSIDWA